MKTTLYPDSRCYPVIFRALSIPIAGAYLEIPSIRVQLLVVQWISLANRQFRKIGFFGLLG